MTINTIQTEKPISKLAAKVGAESPTVLMEAPELPEFYKNQITKNCCVISVARPAEKTKGGLILAETSKEASDYAAQVGRIEAVGPFFYNKKRWGDAEAPQVGDWVMFEPYVGRRFNIGDNRFLIIEDTNILIKKLNPSDDFKLYT